MPSAQVLDAPGTRLRAAELPSRPLREHEIRIRVGACGVCRTDLHVHDGELPSPKLPLVLGHEVVGRIVEGGDRFAVGDRVGVPWLGWTCGQCAYCRSGRENLCPRALFTGYTLDGGYAEEMVADERYCFALRGEQSDAEVAPLLCAGLIGYRALRFAGDAERLALYGFGASAHIVAQIARAQGRRVFAFTRVGDEAAQSLALELGADWAGAVGDRVPDELDAAIIFAPAGELVLAGLAALAPGGRVVCAGIHMSDIPSFPYELLWRERSIASVANLTRADGVELFELLERIPVATTVQEYPLAEAETVLDRLRAGDVRGAAVLVPGLDRRELSSPAAN
jgi:propanol-preferring alcohol dehydrogenase